jgi:hypothetical protein
VSRSSDIPISKYSKNHVTRALTSHLRTQIREVALVHLNTYLATAHVQEPACVPAFQIIILFLWHFDPIPGHGLPLGDFTITLTEHTTIGRTLDEWSARSWPLPENTQHSKARDIHVPGGIGIHNSRKRAAADPHLRPRGHWDRLQIILLTYKTAGYIQPPSHKQVPYTRTLSQEQDFKQHKETRSSEDSFIALFVSSVPRIDRRAWRLSLLFLYSTVSIYFVTSILRIHQTFGSIWFRESEYVIMCVPQWKKYSMLFDDIQ